VYFLGTPWASVCNAIAITGDEIQYSFWGNGWDHQTSRALILQLFQRFYPSWSKVYVEKRIGSSVVKKFPAFCGIGRFITTFTTAGHLLLSWDRPVQFMPPSHCLKNHFNIFLPSTRRSSNWSPFLMLSHQNPDCTSPHPRMDHMPLSSNFSLFEHVNGIWWWTQIITLLVM
jgi:hypothetical protein